MDSPPPPWSSFPYCKPFQVQFLVFTACCAVPLHLQSFLFYNCFLAGWKWNQLKSVVLDNFCSQTFLSLTKICASFSPCCVHCDWIRLCVCNFSICFKHGSYVFYKLAINEASGCNVVCWQTSRNSNKSISSKVQCRGCSDGSLLTSSRLHWINLPKFASQVLWCCCQSTFSDWRHKFTILHVYLAWIFLDLIYFSLSFLGYWHQSADINGVASILSGVFS